MNGLKGGPQFGPGPGCCAQGSRRGMRGSAGVILVCGMLLGAAPAIVAQQQPSNSDAGLVGVPATQSPEDTAKAAWGRLEDSLASKRVDSRIDALSALSLLGGNTRAEGMVRGAMNDESADIDARVAAIVAAGQMDKDRAARPAFRDDLHKLVASNDPKLSFAAATTLWAMHDKAGEDVLVATAEGERASDYGFLKRSEHNASRTLHSPEALAKIAMVQSLTILVPPVGMGMGAYGYLKGTAGPSPQVTAIEQLAKEHTPDVQKALIVATKTKDAAARIAASEALAKYAGPEVADALSQLMLDEKLQVRLTASAAYLAVTGAHAPDPRKVHHDDR